MKFSRANRGWAAVVLAAGTLGLFLPGSHAADPKGDEAALGRTRKQVKMLDDLYKTAIVLVTENYVTEKSDLAAGAAFQKLFATMKKAGHHEVRLLDATGEPYEEKNRPQDAFEKAAIKALKSGKPGYEEVVEKEGKKYLRSATPIPVVMDKCILCHENYKAAKEKKEIIGALGYTIPLE
jgi:Protein of unknown function (DUF3365)